MMGSKPFTVRLAPWSDLETVAQLIRDFPRSIDDAVSVITPAELEPEWRSEGIHLETDARVAVAGTGIGERT